MTFGLPQQSKAVLTVLALALLGQVCFGATNTAATTAAADVQAAINLCNQGDTVLIPAGTSIWQQISVAEAALSITLIGTGGPTTQSKTMIVMSNDNSIVGLGLYTYKTNFVGVYNIIFSNQVPQQYGSVGVFGIDDQSGNRFRISGCLFLMNAASGDRGIGLRDVWGLLDHDYFKNPDPIGNHSFDVYSDVNKNFAVTNAWHKPVFYGTTNCVCAEDCVGDYAGLGDNFEDAYAGAMLTIRYCHITNTVPGWHGADSTCRGTRLVEQYMNDFHTRGGVMLGSCYGNARSGSGVCWSNTYDSGWAGANMGHYNQYRGGTNGGWCSPGGGALVWFLPAGGLQGNMNGSRIVDGNFATNGYPGLDQIGRGSFATNPVMWTATFLTNNYEALEPFYNWSNTVAGVIDPISVAGDDQNNPIPNIIKSGRDYYDGVQKPGYVPLIYPHPLIGTNSPPPAQMAQVQLSNLRIVGARIGQ